MARPVQWLLIIKTDYWTEGDPFEVVSSQNHGQAESRVPALPGQIRHLGPALGGLLPYGLGRAGGELFLLKRVNRERFERMRTRFERQEFLAMMIPSMLPPPTPWKAFVFAAGVFEMRVIPFMLSVFCGRMIRWLVLSLLVLKLGPGAVTVVEHHALPVVGIVGALAVAGFAWWWLRRKRAGKLLED